MKRELGQAVVMTYFVCTWVGEINNFDIKQFCLLNFSIYTKEAVIIASYSLLKKIGN